MRLTAITLSNWKAYRRAQIKLPPAEGHSEFSRNVVIVQGYNGAGKTSLLEAISFCLFGRLGLSMVTRAAGRDRPDYNYDNFLERALNVANRGQSGRMSVLLEFARDGEPVAIERVWHFGASGRHRPDQEEVRLYRGDDHDLIAIPPAPDGQEFVRHFVDQTFIPLNLAEFFLLDGEHIERLSGRSVDEQLWGAIEAALGAPALRTLAADLRSYARDRRRRSPDNLDRRANGGSDALAGLEEEERRAAAAVDQLVGSLSPLRRVREAIVQKIGLLRGESYKTFKALFEEREAAARARDDKREDLRGLLSGDIAMALAGKALRGRVLDRIASEDQAEIWRNASAASHSRFDAFLEAVRRHGASESVPEQILRSAWNELWTTAPDDPGDDQRFALLGESERRAVSAQFNRLGTVEAARLPDLARAIGEHDQTIAAVEREIARQRGVDEESQGLASELAEVQKQIARIEAQHGLEVERLTSCRSELGRIRAELDVLVRDDAGAGDDRTRADRAERYANLAEAVIEAALPASLDRIAQSVSTAYRAMAHKSLVQRVEVHAGEAVRLIGDDGLDVRRVDASAGESQILALAIMSGLADLAMDFPIIMDTPLARLDPVHRRRVLAHFASGSRQLILLTHPAELGPEDLALLEPRLAGQVRIGHVPDGPGDERP